VPTDRYGSDVLAAHAAAKAVRPPEVEAARDLVLEDPVSGFCGAVVGCENGIVVLEDRRSRRRSFPLGLGLLLEGRPVVLKAPRRAAPVAPTHTASGSRAGPREAAKVAVPSRIYVEGRHDAELVEKVWGDDLRHVGVAVEYLGGIDDLPAIVAQFRPSAERRLGVLVDHLVTGTKESRLVDDVMRGPSPSVLITGHPHIDVWQAVKPKVIGIPGGRTCRRARTGRPGRAGPRVAARVAGRHGSVSITSEGDELARPGPGLVTAVERLIDFTQEL
jgi:hypothetical protein